MSAACKKAVTYLAENSGVIAVLTQQEIMTGDPSYALSRIPERKYDTSKGHNPRHVRVRTTPPRRTRYQPMLPQGNQEYQVENPRTGELMTVTGDKTGRGCSLPADTIQYGYDVRNRCLMGKALEAGPWCIMDLLEKEAFKPLLMQLWKDLPRYGKEDFGRQLLYDVITYSHYKYSIAEGFPMSVKQPYFPTNPTGGPSIGFLRKIESLLRAHGWSKDSRMPTIGGRKAVQWYMSREAIEWAIAKRKAELGLEPQTMIYEDDGVFGKTVTYEGMQFIEAEMPTRGYLVPVANGRYEFIEIDPVIVTTADGEGFWTEPNPDYYSSEIFVGGARYRVVEVGFAIHPNAMERQSMGSLPAVPGKTFDRNFDFEVEAIPDWELADRGCNKDRFYFGYRMLHAYAPLPNNPELMTAFLYLAPSNRYQIIDPWVDMGTATTNEVTLAPLAAPPANTCEPCGTPGATVRDPLTPTCDQLFPENGVGVMQFRQTGYDVSEDAASVTVVVERIGGNEGAATVRTNVTEGTATEPENFDPPAGASAAGGNGPWRNTISWADGESGPKALVIPINTHAGDDDGKQFTVVLDQATGAALGAITTTTVTILDADEAA